MQTATKAMPTEVVDYLGLHHIITLSTASFTGMPHANTVAYANDASEIFFVASPESQIVRNINDNRYVSFTIDDYTTDWRKVRELQGVGRAHAATEPERATGLAQMAQKFGPSVALAQGVLFAVRPFEMHFVDYSYEAVTASDPPAPPEITSRVFQLDETAGPGHGPVATSLQRRVVGAGQVIFRPGDPAGQYFVVLQGEVEIRGEGHGADQTVTRVGEGQLFGDQAALRGQRGGLTAHAVSDTVLLAVERDAMRDLLLPEPGS